MISFGFFLKKAASWRAVTKNRENAMTAVPRKIPQIIPTAAAYLGKLAPVFGEKSPLTKSGEITATKAANNPPTADDTSAPAVI